MAASDDARDPGADPPDAAAEAIRRILHRDGTLDEPRLDALRHLADQDALTGALNRRALMRALAAQVRAASRKPADRRRRRPCLILMAVDRFERINDDHGRAVGDAVLCGLADRLAENLRRRDPLGRVGADEFAVCIPQTTVRHAKAIAMRLRGAVAGAPAPTPAGPMPVTVSIGLACYSHGDTRASLTARADEALKAAKRAGCNRVRSAPVARAPSGP